MEAEAGLPNPQIAHTTRRPPYSGTPHSTRISASTKNFVAQFSTISRP